MPENKLTPQDNETLLARLKAAGLEFVVIGGVCVVFHGAPIATFDLDICCPFGIENVKRIQSAVSDLHPMHRLTPNKLPLDLTESSFERLNNLCLQTDLGKLDCLSYVKGVGDYREVLNQSVIAKLPGGEFRFLDLDALITAKKAVGRDRDLDAVRWLECIKEKKNSNLT